MRNQLLLLVALGLAAGICLFVATPAHAKVCEPPGMNDQGAECRPTIRRDPAPAPAPVASPKGVLPFTYAYVITGPVELYANPADVESGIAPLRTLDAGYVWVRLAGRTVYNGQTWYLTDGGGYLPASIAAIYRPSTFQGTILHSQPAFPFAWVLTSVKTSPQPGAKPDAASAAFKRYDIVNIYEQSESGGKMWYRIGENQWIIQTAVGKVEWTPRPAGVGPGEKWIDVNLFEQTVAAYEGDQMVYATLASTGLRRWPTIKGLFRIYAKVMWGPMSGQEGKPDYYSLEDVPWAMYFQDGYSLHGAYWHDGFGYQHSHGCVNLAPLDAQWLYNWTTPAVPQGRNVQRATADDPGTWVWVHD